LYLPFPLDFGSSFSVNVGFGGKLFLYASRIPIFPKQKVRLIEGDDGVMMM